MKISINDVRGHRASFKKIDAIIALRKVTDLGLKEAKEFVETVGCGTPLTIEVSEIGDLETYFILDKPGEKIVDALGNIMTKGIMNEKKDHLALAKKCKAPKWFIKFIEGGGLNG